jgi:VanZ family protein
MGANPPESFPSMLALRYRGFWIASSVVLVAIVVWGSLQTAFSAAPIRGFDKVEHFGTYLCLALWFTGLYRRPRYWLIAVALLGLGLAMEVGQFAMRSGRLGDPYDMAANTGGVAAGLLLALLATGGWAQKVEDWLRQA